MPHETGLITTIVGGLVLAFIFGTIANRLKMPPLVGYLFAGILVGPYTPGFIADTSLAPQLAEIGVILLMFGVGLHFSLRDLMSVRALAIPGAIVQIAIATALGLGLATLAGWGLGGGLVFGLALSVASTVVLLKAMQEKRLIDTEKGRIAVGWLIVEDLAMVLALVLIPAFASLGGETLVHDPFVSFVERLAGTQIGIFGIIGITVVKIAAFIGFMLVVGRRIIPWALHAIAHTGNRELFRLAVLAIALGVALGSSYLFGVSLALGAFFAGMILSESELSQRAAQETLPLRDAFAVLFFVSVGMLFNPNVLAEQPFLLLGTLFIILIGKTAVAFGIVLLFRQPVSTALIISASLAQIGEFSFILAELGVGLKLLPPEGRDLILAGAIISIMLNPVLFFIAERMRPRLEAKARTRRGEAEPATVRAEPTLDTDATGAETLVPDDVQEPIAHDNDDDSVEPTRKTGHTVLIGYGRVGSVVGHGLLADNAPFVLIEDADNRVAKARAEGVEVVVGNAASPDILALANVGAAKCLVVAIPNGFEAGQATEQCRKLNAGIRIITRSHSEEEEEYFKRLGADVVIMGEREIGMGMLAYIHGQRGAPAPEIEPVVVKLPQNPNLLQDIAEAQQRTADEAVDPLEADGQPEEPIMLHDESFSEIAPVQTSEVETALIDEIVVEPAPPAAETDTDAIAAVEGTAGSVIEPVQDPVKPGEPAEPIVPEAPEPAPEKTPEPTPEETPKPDEPIPSVPPVEEPPQPAEHPVDVPGNAPIEAPAGEPQELPAPDLPVEAPVPAITPDAPPTPAEVPSVEPVWRDTPVAEASAETDATAEAKPEAKADAETDDEIGPDKPSAA